MYLGIGSLSSFYTDRYDKITHDHLFDICSSAPAVCFICEFNIEKVKFLKNWGSDFSSLVRQEWL